jgi:Capsule polysaccharide biosynthesis protein
LRESLSAKHANGMNILLICKGEYRYFFPGIAQALWERYGAKVSAVTFSSPTTQMLQERGAFQQVFNLAAWLKKRNGTEGMNGLEIVRNLEALPGSVKINTMIHADRILGRYSEEQIIALLGGVAEFWENIWEQGPPDVIVGEVACATEWIGWLMAREHGIPHLIPCPTAVANRFFFLHEPDGMWHAMADAFHRLKQRELTREEASAAETFIRSFRAKKTKPPFLQWAQHSPLMPEFSRLARRIARIPFRIQTYLADGQFELGSYHGTPPWRPVWEDTARIARHAASEMALFAHRFDTRRHSVYFPLHVQPEFTTDVRAPFLTNQIALVENISKSVPVGYQVLVKEHPGMKGERSLGYYRDLRKLHNVRLLSPSLDSHDVMRASDAVLTITGSSAWEAILYEKPVIAFGPLCYGFYDLIYKCENIADLRRALSKVIEGYAPKHEGLLKLVSALLESAYQLEWADPVRQPRVAEKRNCEKVADAIVSELASRVEARSEKAVLAYHDIA